MNKSDEKSVIEKAAKPIKPRETALGFDNLGIKSRVILLGTIPAMLFAIILAGYAISNVFDVMNQSLSDRGRIIWLGWRRFFGDHGSQGCRRCDLCPM